MTREPAKNPAASIRARLLALAQSKGQDSLVDCIQAATRRRSKWSAFYSGHSFCRASIRYRRLNQLPTTGLRAFTGANRNELQRRQANLDSAGQHSIVGYRFGYRHQFGSITDNYAKLLMGSHLWISEITLDFGYLS
jgi:hypothetical protein